MLEFGVIKIRLSNHPPLQRLQPVEVRAFNRFGQSAGTGNGSSLALRPELHDRLCTAPLAGQNGVHPARSCEGCHGVSRGEAMQSGVRDRGLT